MNDYDAVKFRGGFRGFLRLFSSKRCLDAACFCVPDENGLRHVLVCRVLMGRMQLVTESNIDIGFDFDSGVDHLENPRKIYLPYWNYSQMYHICLDAIVSFSMPPYVLAFALEGSSPNLEPGAIELASVLYGLKVLLNDSNSVSTAESYFSEYEQKRKSRAELIYELLNVFGMETLVEAAKAVSVADSYIA